MMEQVYSYRQLFSFAKNIFLKRGCNDANANTATNVLLSADLRGVDSHGIARQNGYVRLWQELFKLLAPTQRLATLSDNLGCILASRNN